MDINAKLSLDLLIGLSILLVTFIFVASFLPGIFADVRHEIALANHAYRIATLLVEDPGYPSDWAEIDVTECGSKKFRPGLANFDYENGTLYNYLNASKILKLQELARDTTCLGIIKENLGLSYSNINYGFNFSLTNFSGYVFASGGEEVPLSGQVVSFERVVYVDNCTAFPCDEVASRCLCVLEVVVWT
ncbi:MAG: hypothetical protein ABWW66_03845 [Archaeoglobaceae archaeon]